jgi:uncharacterized Zn finger protein
MSLPADECRRCSGTRLHFGWQVFRNGTRHIRVECAECGAYVCYAPQTPENLRRAGPPPAGGPAGEESP